MRPLPFGCALVALLTVALPAQQKFASRVESVRVDVLVTANGSPVLGTTRPPVNGRFLLQQPCSWFS